ncbi:MAG: ABC transporter permease [Candidatus Limnocylindrales bacterium]|jgi:peptide/nickel transport system permease protein
MIKYIVRRALQAIPVLIGITILCFVLMHLQPGNPTDRFAQNPKITQAQIAAFEHRWGLLDPLPEQYCKWLGVCGDKGVLNFLPGGTLNIAGLSISLPGGDNGLLHGDLGYSINNGLPVTDVIASRLPATVLLCATAYLIWITLAFMAGVYAAVRRYGLFDSVLTIFNYVGYSLPTFWLGLILITFLSEGDPFKWFPASGMWDARTVPAFATSQYWAFFGSNPLYAITDLARHLALPVLTLVAVSIAGDSRFIRSSMLDSLNQDYIKTARAKGVSETGVVFRHALRNALLPVVTNIALEIPFIFGGAVATETVFSWPGMGRQFVESVGYTDYPVLMGILLISSVIVVLANLLADIMYAVVDPRVKYD